MAKDFSHWVRYVIKRNRRCVYSWQLLDTTLSYCWVLCQEQLTLIFSREVFIPSVAAVKFKEYSLQLSNILMGFSPSLINISKSVFWGHPKAEFDLKSLTWWFPFRTEIMLMGITSLLVLWWASIMSQG